MIDQITAHGRVHVHRDGDFQLGAHAVRARNQNRFFVFFLVQLEQRAEAPDSPEHSICKSTRGEMADAIFGVVRDSDVHSSVCVFHGCARALNLEFMLQSDERGFATKL